MKWCPKCKCRTARIQVNLFLDIPSSMAHRLSKANLRSRLVEVLGAGWDRATYYCSNSSCGWTLRLAKGKR